MHQQFLRAHEKKIKMHCTLVFMLVIEATNKGFGGCHGSMIHSIMFNIDKNKIRL
jgi:hypothetical protein